MLAGQIRRHGVCDPKHPAYLKPLEGIAAGIEASAASAEARWTKAHQALVDKAIEDVAGVKPLTMSTSFSANTSRSRKVWPHASLLPSALVS
jgi:hypothetical protein